MTMKNDDFDTARGIVYAVMGCLVVYAVLLVVYLVEWH
jgi:hypothetical protein